MKAEEVIAIVEEYQRDFQRILSRFVKTSGSIHIWSDDDSVWRQKVLEIRDFLNDTLEPKEYSRQIIEYLNEGILD